jgi:CBS domain-containing protein
MTAKAQVPRAGDLMTREVETVTEDLSLEGLVDFLLERRLSCAPVVRHEPAANTLVGFVSESDALELMANEIFYGEPESPQSVATCMKRHPVSITDDVDLFAIASLLVNHGYRHLPVVDRNNALLGIISRSDVMRAVARFHALRNRESDAAHFRPDLHKIMNHRFILTG